MIKEPSPDLTDNSWMEGSHDIMLWSDVKFADGLIEVIDEKEGKCRLKSKERLSADMRFTHAYILIPHWFKSSIYGIDKIKDGYIYFTATDLEDGYNQGYNVNDDYNYGKRDIRYKLCNIENNTPRLRNGTIILPDGLSAVREGLVKQYFVFQDCVLKSVCIKGLSFYGNSFAQSKPAIYFRNIQSNKINIRNCNFVGLHGTVMSFAATPNVIVENNRFEDCHHSGIISDNQSSNTVIKNNNFINMSKRMLNTFCITCKGENYYVSDNVLTDYGYCGIGVGVRYKNQEHAPCYGFVENNSLTYSDQYFADSLSRGLMDSGAIYLWTKNKGSVIRNNYIHQYSGMRSNRGILCDDGAYGFQIYENIILGIANSYCIDSRRVPRVEQSSTPESGIIHSNVDNIIRNNVIDGRIRFVGNEDPDNGCIKGPDYVIRIQGESQDESVVSNVSILEQDIFIDVDRNNGGGTSLSQIQDKSSLNKEMKRFVRRALQKFEY